MSIKKKHARYLVVAALCSHMSFSHGFSLEGSLFDKIGTKYEIDPLLLYSVAIAESAISAGNKDIKPTPYVFRTDKGPKYFNTKEAAEEALKVELQHTNRIDIGMMQVNLFWHPQDEPLKLLDPTFNLETAAKYLKKTMSSTSNQVVGVGRYHSWTKYLTDWYGEYVWKIHTNLSSISQ